jgi:hypothetical protein
MNIVMQNFLTIINPLKNINMLTLFFQTIYRLMKDLMNLMLKNIVAENNHEIMLKSNPWSSLRDKTKF